MAINLGMMSSKTPEWSTPQELFNRLDEIYQFQLDPCATAENHKCQQYFTEKDNGLALDWHTYSSIFMNPPYGRQISLWIAKAYSEAQKGCVVVCLLPARTDTAWWHDYCMKGEIEFIRGRLKFSDSKNSAPFPSAIITFRRKNAQGPSN